MKDSSHLLLATFVILYNLNVCSSFRPTFGWGFQQPAVHRLPKKRASSLKQNEIAVSAESVLDEKVKNQLSELVKLRANKRWNGDYASADRLREQIELLDLPEGFRVVVQDIPRSEGGGSSWKLVYELPVDEVKGQSVLNLAHAALGMAVSASERKASISSEQLDRLVHQAKDQLRRWSAVDDQIRLSKSPSTEFELSFEHLHSLGSQKSGDLAYWNAVENGLSGRKAADAAFWFALAGVTDSELFELLTRVCTKEIERFGERPSCRAKDILTIAERIAAAGVRSDLDLERAMMKALKAKAFGSHASKVDASEFLDLHSDHCALMIWKFSTRQRKQRCFLKTAAEHWEQHNSLTSQSLATNRSSRDLHWDKIFADSRRPLVIDVGCGMGVSLLGLASLGAADCQNFDWPSYNFIGVDLSSVAIAYANGIARRWELQDRLTFVVDSAENLLQSLRTYPGSVELILIQFPTPYRLLPTSESGGNSQLPSSATDGFMVTIELLQLAAGLLQKSHANQKGRLIVQSNCEDVAVYIRHLACSIAGFEAFLTNDSLAKGSGVRTQRTLNWIAMGGERAMGAEWSSRAILPRKGRTETEIACKLNDTPVHRCVLVV